MWILLHTKSQSNYTELQIMAQVARNVDPAHEAAIVSTLEQMQREQRSGQHIVQYVYSQGNVYSQGYRLGTMEVETLDEQHALQSLSH